MCHFWQPPSVQIKKMERKEQTKIDEASITLIHDRFKCPEIDNVSAGFTFGRNKNAFPVSRFPSSKCVILKHFIGTASRGLRS
ncbi:MAG: hypothetical protein ACM3WQ_02380 [Chloroflexota bacterium]